MRLGLIGPAPGLEPQLRDATDLLLSTAGATEVLYLGVDPALETVVRTWAAEVAPGLPNESAFLQRAVDAACNPNGESIDALLQADQARRRLQAIKRVPDAPARTIELIGKWVLLAVHDKRWLEEEDIINAHVIAHGRARKAELRHFGPRHFVTPGPLSGGELILLETNDDAQLEVRCLRTDGATAWKEALGGRGSRLQVGE